MERSPKKIFKIKEGIFGKKTGRFRAFPISLISSRCNTGLGETALKSPFQLFIAQWRNKLDKSDIWIQLCHCLPDPNADPAINLIGKANLVSKPPRAESTRPILIIEKLAANEESFLDSFSHSITIF